MRIIKVKDYAAMTAKLLEIFTNTIKQKPDCVLSFTTGATPRGFLEGLAEEINQGLDIQQCIFCNLDEYVGMKDSVYSVYRFMHETLYDRIKTKPKAIYMFNGEASDKEKELERYGKILKDHSRDIQLLGLGVNGHIGANEPGTSFQSSLFVADSKESTIRSTQLLYNLTEEETPKQMYTMGFQEIMAAKCVILAVSGKSKAEAVKKIMEKKITEKVPATYLWNHPNCIIIMDEDAASLLPEDAGTGEKI